MSEILEINWKYEKINSEAFFFARICWLQENQVGEGVKVCAGELHFQKVPAAFRVSAKSVN